MSVSRSLSPEQVVSRSRVTGRFWAVLLGLFPLANFTLRPPLDLNATLEQGRDPSSKLAGALVILAMAGVLPALWGAVSLGVDFRRAKYFLVSVFIMCLSIPLSFLMRTEIQLILYVVIVYNVIAYEAVSISTNLDEDAMLTSLFATLAVVHALMLLIVLKDNNAYWGRLWGRDTPAYWGMVAQTALLCCVAMRGWMLRGLVIVISLIILYYTQSRGSMLATIVGAVVEFVIFASTSKWRAPLWIAAVLGVVFVLMLGSGFITEDLFKVSDPSRGAGSGLTGRASAWEETMTLITNNPWVGVGYRQHEHYLTTEASAHNAYLATLADTGVIGFFGYMIFLLGGTARAVMKAIARPTGATIVCAGFLGAFLMNGMVERTALNTGNAYCQLMILIAAFSWRQDRPDLA